MRPSLLLRRFSTRHKPSSKTNLPLLVAPHATLAACMLATANAHMLFLPITTLAVHYLWKYNHIRKATLYYDMQKLGKNENYMATFEKVRSILLTDPRFEVLIEQQRMDEGGSDATRSTTLIFENPTFMPFAYKVQGMTGQIDEAKQRFAFTCQFRDLVRGSKGNINALIIFTRQKEAFFESLTVRFEQPRELEFKITESTEDLTQTEPKDPKRWNEPLRPRGDNFAPKE